MEAIQVLCTLRFTDQQLDQLKAVSPRLVVTQRTCSSAEDVAAALADFPLTEILYTFFVPSDLLDLASGLCWVQLHSAGTDHILNHPLMRSDLAITTTSGIHATPIAEYTFASILAHRWQVPRWTRCQRERNWPSGRWQLYTRPELRGSTLGIVGYGSIGREVGRIARGFGMRVLALRRSPGRVEEGYVVDYTGDPEGYVPERFFPPEALQSMLAECDYIVIALPLTPETYHYIGRAELQAMKPSAYMVNIARGPIVDEEALIEALNQGWLAGAGLDVFEQEPLPKDSPLWEQENLLISPHVAGFSPRYDDRAAALFAQNLARYIAGEALLNLVNREKGY